VNFDQNEEQRLLAESVRRLVAQDYSFEARRRIVASPGGCSETAWKAFADMGLLGLPVPSEYGGFGGGAVDMMSTMEAIGDALVVEPYLSTVGLGAAFIARGATPAHRAQWLPVIAEGRVKLAFAHTEAASRYELESVATRARREGDAFVIDGAKRAVTHGALADLLVASARTSGAEADPCGISLFLVDASAPGVERVAHRALDGTRGADVTFRSVRVPADALLAGEGEAFALIEEVVDFATALVCAEAIGAMRYANEATLEYLKTRRQFGVPIGAFQALQHRMVDMAVSLEQARSMANLACARVDAAGDAQSRKRVVSAAKVRVAEACRHISQESVQLHGGMGMSDELKISHTFRRLTAIAQQFGDVDHHLERFAAHSPSAFTEGAAEGRA
jgi:alkylation response protein AidB-like acyl-CoA dehydrogenase